MVKRAKDFSEALVKTFEDLNEDSIYCRKFVLAGKAPRKNINKKPDESFGTYKDDNGYFHKQYVTTVEVDRDNEVVLQSGIDWNQYKENNIVLNFHDRRVKPIGQCVKLEKDSYGWAGTTKYYVNDKKDSIGYDNWEYRSKGFPMGLSIGFAVKEYAVNKRYGEEYAIGWDVAYEKWADEFKSIYNKKPTEDPDVILTKIVVYEYSDVSIPSNPGAVGAKNDLIVLSKGIETNGLIDASKLKIKKDNVDMKENEELEEKKAKAELDEKLSVLENSIIEIKNILTLITNSDSLYLSDDDKKKKETEDKEKTKIKAREDILSQIEKAINDRNDKLIEETEKKINDMVLELNKKMAFLTGKV